MHDQAVGRKDPSGQLRVQEQRNEKGLIAALDEYLRTTKTRFRDVFDSCDPRKLGYLDISGLAKLLRIVMPNVTEGELYYFQVGASKHIYIYDVKIVWMY